VQKSDPALASLGTAPSSSLHRFRGTSLGPFQLLLVENDKYCLRLFFVYMIFLIVNMTIRIRSKPFRFNETFVSNRQYPGGPPQMGVLQPMKNCRHSQNGNGKFPNRESRPSFLRRLATPATSPRRFHNIPGSHRSLVTDHQSLVTTHRSPNFAPQQSRIQVKMNSVRSVL
jgi:hypothetical protein